MQMEKDEKDLYDKLGEDGVAAFAYLVQKGFTAKDYADFLGVVWDDEAGYEGYPDGIGL